MFYPVVDFGTLRIVEAVYRADKVTRDPPDAFKLHAFAYGGSAVFFPPGKVLYDLVFPVLTPGCSSNRDRHAPVICNA